MWNPGHDMNVSVNPQDGEVPMIYVYINVNLQEEKEEVGKLPHRL